ncbi:hypothetical protein NL676_016924 [Syzygium grande]|nr:hypothetical protein NL676_016924 [Syzygium grande]
MRKQSFTGSGRKKTGVDQSTSAFELWGARFVERGAVHGFIHHLIKHELRAHEIRDMETNRLKALIESEKAEAESHESRAI